MRFHVKSFGCQMSFHDGERIAAVLRGVGHEPVEDPTLAELLLATTCTVRGKADEKVYSWLGRQKWLKGRSPPGILAVCGCMAQAHGRRIFQRAPQVDLVLGPGALGRLAVHLEAVRRRRHRIVDLEPPGEELPETASPTSPVKAWVTVIEGCDNYCAYCIVPYVRGSERSRRSMDVLREVEGLVDRGIREVTLLGQNVNSYRPEGDKIRFPELLRRVAAVPGLLRLRFVTSHPKDLSQELVQAMADCPVVCPQLHLPVQSGADPVLTAMNRGYRRGEYLERVGLLRRRIPGIALTTDILCGFPGETEEDHQDTMSLLKEVRFDSAFGFAYSPRDGTAAARREDDVPGETKQRRLAEVLAFQKEITTAHRAAQVGSVQAVLVEDRAPRGELLAGRSPGGVVVHLPGPEDWIGREIPVLIREATPNCLYGAPAVAEHPPGRL